MIEINFATRTMRPLGLISMLERLCAGPVHDVGSEAGLVAATFIRRLGLAHERIDGDEVSYCATLAGHAALRAWNTSAQSGDGDSDILADLKAAYRENARITQLLDTASDVIIEIARTGDANLAQAHIDAHEAWIKRPDPAS